MDKYKVLGVVGEGSYGQVIKCLHKESGRLVAIKKFIETEEDVEARKMALREIKMLKRLRHDNLVNMIEVFRRKKRFHLVFEFLKGTLLDIMEDADGFSEKKTREFALQILRGLDFCHSNNIVHRDLKPENILVSENDVVKIADFGFARFVTISQDPFTDYVATRWYRAPELLVLDVKYGRAVDIWVFGLIVAEMRSNIPMFTGESDLDQLYKITGLIGALTSRQKQCLLTRLESGYGKSSGITVSLEQLEPSDEECRGFLALQKKYPYLERKTMQIVSDCLKMNPQQRPKSDELIHHVYFAWDDFPKRFEPELQKRVCKDLENTPKVQKVPCLSKEYHLPETQSLMSCPSVSDWKIDPMPFVSGHAVSKLKAQIITFKKKSSEIIGTLSLGKSSITPSIPSITQSPESSKITSQSTIQKKTEFLKEREVPGLLKHNKIIVKYRRDFLPETKRIIPFNGRLVIDHEDKLLCSRAQFRKNHCRKIFAYRISLESRWDPAYRRSLSLCPQNPRNIIT